MLCFFKKIIKEIFKCRHKNALLHSNEGYCPDCGKYLKKSYRLVRCSCCGIKRSAKNTFGVIAPQEKYCANCGETEYTIEKCEKLNLVDINYAIGVKEVVDTEFEDKIEIWIEDENKPCANSSTNAPFQIKYIGVNL